MVWFAGFFGRASVRPANRAGWAADEFATGEIIVLNRLVEREDDAAGGAIEAVHGDAVENTSGGVEGDLALFISARNDVIVARNRCQSADAAAGINPKQCIEAAADCVDGDRLVIDGRPLVPDGMSPGIARMIRFAGLFGGKRVEAGDAAEGAWKRLRAGEIIVERRPARTADGDRDLNDIVGVIGFLN